MSPREDPSGVDVVHRFGADSSLNGDSPDAVSDDKAKIVASGYLRKPRGLHLKSDGTLLVADYDRHCVMSFAPGKELGTAVAGTEGQMLPTLDPLKNIDRPVGPVEGEGFLLKRPIAVCEDSAGALLVVDADASRIQRFKSQRAKGEDVVPVPGGPPQKSVHAPEAVKYPRAVLHRKEDNSLIVCDTWSHRILCFHENATTPTVLAGIANSCGTSPSHLSFPSGICFDKAGNLLVADTNNHRVQRFALGCTSGTTVAGSPSGQAGQGLDELNMPTSICVHPETGALFVTDRFNARVLRFHERSQGGSAGEVVVPTELLQRPWGIAIDSEGLLHVSDERLGVVLRISIPSGEGPLPESQEGQTKSTSLEIEAPVEKDKAVSENAAPFKFAPPPRIRQSAATAEGTESTTAASEESLQPKPAEPPAEPKQQETDQTLVFSEMD